MRITQYRDPARHIITYTLELEDVDLESMQFTTFDRLLLDDCVGSTSIADILLGLETIARRIEEAWLRSQSATSAPSDADPGRSVVGSEPVSNEMSNELERPAAP